MNRYVLALLAGAGASCGLVGSTAGYAGSFCGSFDSAALFCNSFDLTDAEDDWTSQTEAGGPLLEYVELGPDPATSPPNVLHILRGDGGPHGDLSATNQAFAGGITCSLELSAVTVGTKTNNMVASFEVTPLEGGASYELGLMVGRVDGGLAADIGTCDELSCRFAATPGNCPSAKLPDDGGFALVGFTVLSDAGTYTLIDSCAKTASFVVPSTGPPRFVVGLTQGDDPSSPDAAVHEFEAYVDNVRCTSP